MVDWNGTQITQILLIYAVNWFMLMVVSRLLIVQTMEHG